MDNEGIASECPWCGRPILSSDACGEVDGELMHVDCALTEQDETGMDAEFGDNG